MFAALEFDHDLFKPQIKWIVVECSGIGQKCGGPIAHPPRCDRAYFISPETAREDAEAYADFKNHQEQRCLSKVERAALLLARHGKHPTHHRAYPWDHLLLADSPLSWAVFEWSGNDAIDGQRIDAAYFTHAHEVGVDAMAFAFLREKNRSMRTQLRVVPERV
ncbi:hypothetical protein EC912_105220 [Luteibacter rhizovicinus]|uniref:Uncharacterized protein n=1 Tax=Luteibacter rhizovicinus TaxID=242606 RepID=A0A4R3YM48_9GAMM|nr:hypothetical protein [Luteibacter rhizovicinus]TCV93360.1 hypothetical protein EC912_105220 [Luteibacter rhizovicinus]